MPGSFNTITISATVAEGGNLTVTITPSSALSAATTVRWHDGRDDTPWYAGMRLFRQPAPADWQGVVAPLRAAVQEKFKL